MSQKAPYVGVTVSKFENLTPYRVIRALRFLKMEFVEFNRSIIPEIDKVAENAGNMKSAFHLPLIAEDGWDFSCSEYQKEIDEITNILNAYREKLNIQHVVCHPPELVDADKSLHSSIDLLIENLKRLELPVHLENVPSVPPQEYEAIYATVKNALGSKLDGICFDAPHFFIKGIDPIDKYRAFNGDISSIHLSDCLEDKDVHIPFESGGVLPVHEFLREVKASKFNRSITLEIRPNSLSDLDSYIDSYLTTLRYVNPKKYLKTKLRVLTLRPFLRFVTA